MTQGAAAVGPSWRKLLLRRRVESGATWRATSAQTTRRAGCEEGQAGGVGVVQVPTQLHNYLSLCQ